LSRLDPRGGKKAHWANSRTRPLEKKTRMVQWPHFTMSQPTMMRIGSRIGIEKRYM